MNRGIIYKNMERKIGNQVLNLVVEEGMNDKISIFCTMKSAFHHSFNQWSILFKWWLLGGIRISIRLLFFFFFFSFYMGS